MTKAKVILDNIYIRSAADAKGCIGQRVYWEEISNRYVFLRQGTLEEVSGKNICISGNWQWRTKLANLRNYE